MAGKPVSDLADKNANPKDRILVEAEKLFAEKGFDGVSVRDIAERAQVNAAMINYYFHNKDELYLGIVENYLAELSVELEDVLRGATDPLIRLEKFIACYTDFMFRKSRSAQLIVRAGLYDDKHIALFAEKYFGQIVSRLECIIGDGVEQGYFEARDAKLTVISLLGPIIYFFVASPVLSRLPGMEDYQQYYRQSLAGHTMDFFVHGMSRREGV